MTKYILHGGDTSDNNPDNNGFFREMSVGVGEGGLVLLNYFSREEKEMPQLAEQDKARIVIAGGNKNLQFEIAEENRLGEQLKRAQVMYMRGGKTKRLLEKLSKTPNLEGLFEGKTIAGSSAGAYVLVKYYYGNNSRKLGQGLGLLKMKAYCHYTPQDTEAVNKLLAYKERLPLLVLPNYKWVVFYR